MLSPSQEEAVCHGSGPCLTLAGPGSGKTYVLTRRIQHLITKGGVPPEQILVITFTKAAALEMRKRFIGLMGQEYPSSLERSILFFTACSGRNRAFGHTACWIIRASRQS